MPSQLHISVVVDIGEDWLFHWIVDLNQLAFALVVLVNQYFAFFAQNRAFFEETLDEQAVVIGAQQCFDHQFLDFSHS